MNKDNKYSNVVKSTILFGSVKIVEFAVTLIRMKIVAVLLGPYGLGIQAMFQSVLNTITQFASFGIFQSSIREIAKNSESDTQRETIVHVVLKLSYIVAFLGFLICFIFAPFISEFSLESKDFTVGYRVLSLACLFYLISSGNIAIMQGRRQMRDIAKSSLFGAIFGLVSVIPVYYIYGVDAIPYALSINYLVILLFNSFYVRKIKVSIGKVEPSLIYDKSKSIIRLGIVLMLANLLMTLFSFLTNAFISSVGQVEDVGYYNAAFTINYGCIAILVAVLTSDFYPRLSALQNDVKQVNEITNQQIELLLLIVAPISVALILLSPYFLEFLYSKEFISISYILQFMSFSLIFRIIWQTFSYIILSKGDKKSFLIYDAIIANGFAFLLNILFYKFWGLWGLGVSFVVSSVVVSTFLFLIVRFKYGFIINSFILKFIISFILIYSIVYIYTVVFHNGIDLISILLVLCSCIISFVILNTRINFLDFIKTKIAR